MQTVEWWLELLTPAPETDSNMRIDGCSVRMLDEDGEPMWITFPTHQKALDFAAVIYAIEQEKNPVDCTVRLSVFYHEITPAAPGKEPS